MNFIPLRKIKITIMKNKLILFLFVVLAGCSTNLLNDTNYSRYKPVLMQQDQFLNAIHLIQSPEKLDTVGKMQKIGDYLFVLDLYKGLHILQLDSSQKIINLSFLVIPGIIDFVVSDSMIYANSATDLVSLKFNSYDNIELIDRQQNVFYELMPPDRRQPDPVFSKGSRPDNTVIVGWQPDNNFGDLDTLLMPYYLFALKDNYLLAALGDHILVFDISGQKPVYKSVFQGNNNFIEKMQVFGNYLFTFSMQNMEVYSLSSITTPNKVNEYSGISAGSYIAIEYGQSYKFFATFHSSALYYSTADAFALYDLGHFDKINLDTSFGLYYPLGILKQDTTVYVCDRGIKIFSYDSLLTYKGFKSGDDLDLFGFNDSTLVSLGARTINSYRVKDSILEPVDYLPIKYAWLIRF